MSNARAHRRRADRAGRAVPSDDIKKMIEANLVRQGCTCSPSIRWRRHDKVMTHLEVRHDNDCPALANGPHREFLLRWPS